MLRWSVVSILILLQYGCASPPIQEMSDARQTIEAARESGVESAAPGSLARADELLTEAQNELERNNFKRARVDAINAKIQAEKARMLADVIAETRGVLGESNVDARAVQKATDLIQQALDHAGGGNMDKALRLAREARRMVGLAR